MATPLPSKTDGHPSVLFGLIVLLETRWDRLLLNPTPNHGVPHGDALDTYLSREISDAGNQE